MAGPLRRVSQTYNWTLERPHDYLHKFITPELRPTLAPSPVVPPWDSARLQWKFKSEYDELREHLERSLLILLGWWLTIKHLAKAAAEHFIARPDQAVSNPYKQSAKLSIYDMFSITLWGLLVALFRLGYAVPRLGVAFPAQSFFSRLATNRFGANKREEIGSHPALSPSTRQPLPGEMPAQSPYIESTARTPFEGSPTITVMSDTAHWHSALDESLTEDGIEELHERGGHSFHGSLFLDGDIRKPHEEASEIAGLFD